MPHYLPLVNLAQEEEESSADPCKTHLDQSKSNRRTLKTFVVATVGFLLGFGLASIYFGLSQRPTTHVSALAKALPFLSEWLTTS